MIKKIFYLFLAAFIIIQFFHPAKNISANASPANDISKVFIVPNNVNTILKNSCYDCHSSNTQYPWYSKIQPAAWLLNDHIEEGKREVNFNEFATYSLRRQYKKFEEIIKQVKEEEMPLSSYTFIHRGAELSKEQKLVLYSWAAAAMDNMKAKYPADSLKKK